MPLGPEAVPRTFLTFSLRARQYFRGTAVAMKLTDSSGPIRWTLRARAEGQAVTSD